MYGGITQNWLRVHRENAVPIRDSFQGPITTMVVGEMRGFCTNSQSEGRIFRGNTLATPTLSTDIDIKVLFFSDFDMGAQ